MKNFDSINLFNTRPMSKHEMMEHRGGDLRGIAIGMIDLITPPIVWLVINKLVSLLYQYQENANTHVS